MTFAQQVADFAMPILGMLMLALVGFIGRVFIKRMDDQDRSLKDIKDLLTSETALLRNSLHELDKRVIWIESTCLLQHGKTSGTTYRNSDGD